MPDAPEVENKKQLILFNVYFILLVAIGPTYSKNIRQLDQEFSHFYVIKI